MGRYRGSLLRQWGGDLLLIAVALASLLAICALSASPAHAQNVHISGNDGTTYRDVLVDSAGVLKTLSATAGGNQVQGGTAANAGATENPVLMGGSSSATGTGGTKYNWTVSNTGEGSVRGILGTGVSAATAPGFMVGGSDGTNYRHLSVDGSGHPVIVGNIASASADSGNPVKVGCRYNLSLPTFTDGQRGDCQVGVKGNILVSLVDLTSGGAIASQGTVDGDGARNGLTVYNRATLYNGSTQDMAFTCANSAVVNVTAAATTQIVALVAAKTIRVCSLAISMSAAGTAKVVYGTGSNCGTGTTDLTGAMTLATGTPLAMSAPEGGSLLRTAVANALCVTAVTGNVTGFLTYAQY